MTNQQHPITPPSELVQQWMQGNYYVFNSAEYEQHIATKASQWGADQELEACCEWLCTGYSGIAEQLRAARRPKPPSLKEQAIALIDLIQGNEKSWYIQDLDVVRRALKALDD